MTSFEEIEIDEQSRVGSEFISSVTNEIQRALVTERAERKITQQSIADKIGTSRAVVNRQIQGLENLGARRMAELLWAIGWEPYFEARKIPAGGNQFTPSPGANTASGVLVFENLRVKPKPNQPTTPVGSDSSTLVPG